VGVAGNPEILRRLPKGSRVQKPQTGCGHRHPVKIYAAAFLIGVTLLASGALR
jgi:hypothetical protein